MVWKKEQLSCLGLTHNNNCLGGNDFTRNSRESDLAELPKVAIGQTVGFSWVKVTTDEPYMAKTI